MKQLKIRYNYLYRKNNRALPLMLSPDNSVFSDGNIAFMDNTFHLDKQTETKAHVNQNLTKDRIIALTKLYLENKEVDLTEALTTMPICEDTSNSRLTSYVFGVGDKFLAIQKCYYTEIINPLLKEGCTFIMSPQKEIPELDKPFKKSYINGIVIYNKENEIIGAIMPVAINDDKIEEILLNLEEEAKNEK